MTRGMLRRFKTVGPKMKIFLGLWLGLELLSIPAAAQMVRHMKMVDDSVLVAEELDTGEPGKARFLVTHTAAFDVAVSGVTGNIIVMVENAAPGNRPAFETAECVSVSSTQLRTVYSQEVSPHQGDTSPYKTAFVTLFYDATAEPDIHLEPKIFAPESKPCDAQPI